MVVLEVDPAKRRISLGLKQTLENPWEAFARNHPVGSQVEGEVKNKTEFGLFIGLEGDVDGMVHLSDLDWTRPGEQVDRGVQPRRHGQGPGARRRYREGAHLARHQAAGHAIRSARRRRRANCARTRSSPARSSASRMAASRCGSSISGIETFIKRSDLSPRPRRAAAGALRRRPEGRCARDRLRQEDPQAAASRSRRWKSPRRRKRSPSTARPTPAPRSATSWAPR